MIRLLATCAALALAAPAAAETVAIVDATLMTMTDAGEIAQGTIVIRDGRIMAIGPDVTVPAGARVVDGRGGVVTPGFIQADSTLGAVEVSPVPASSSAERRVGTECVSTCRCRWSQF